MLYLFKAVSLQGGSDDEAFVNRARSAAPLAVCLLAFAATAFAQGGMWSVAAQGVSTEAVAVAKWLGIACVVIFGITLMMDHEHGVMKKVTMLIFGGIFAMFGAPIVAWIQSL